MIEIILQIVGGVTIIFLVFFGIYSLLKNKKSRKDGDKPSTQNKHKNRPPTWKFQKYNPNICPHNNGVFRKVKYKILDKTMERSIFVCADCLGAIDRSELEERDKFKTK